MHVHDRNRVVYDFPKLLLQKGDHNILKSSNYGSCKICLCNSYPAFEPKLVAPLPDAVSLEQD